MLCSMSSSGMSTIGRPGSTALIASRNSGPLVLAVEIVDDEKAAALEVFAQPLELLALRKPVALPRLLQEQPRIVEHVVVG